MKKVWCNMKNNQNKYTKYSLAANLVIFAETCLMIYDYISKDYFSTHGYVGFIPLAVIFIVSLLANYWIRKI